MSADSKNESSTKAGRHLWILGIGTLMAYGCARPDRTSGTLEIADATKTNVFQLVTSGWSGLHGDLPSGLHLELTGHLDGTASIVFSQWETQKISGAVNWRIGKDWFETNCLFRYYPEDVKSGRLILKYQFL